MEEVELGCAVYGEGTVFPVKIARDAKVSALQEKIFEKKRYSESYKFSASDLTLYLVKKNGAWLKDDDNVEEVLQGKIDIAYKKMRPTWKLNKPEYCGDFQLGEETIHVLVELPKRENRAKYHAKEALEEDSPIGSFGGSKNEALIVAVPDADDGDEGSHFIRLQAILSLIVAVLYAAIKILGEDPEDEKGCLNTGAYVWVCYVIGIYLVLTAMNAILDVWKTSCRTRSKERTPLLPLSKNQKKRMKKKRKRSKWWPFHIIGLSFDDVLYYESTPRHPCRQRPVQYSTLTDSDDVQYIAVSKGV